MKINLFRFDGAFFIGQETAEVLSTIYRPAMVLYMPVEGRIHGAPSIGFSTAVVFLGCDYMNVNEESLISTLLDTDPLKIHYVNTLMQYERNLKSNLQTN
jgi:hypothetical protein